jgi:hypothetical protein
MEPSFQNPRAVGIRLNVGLPSTRAMGVVDAGVKHNLQLSGPGRFAMVRQESSRFAGLFRFDCISQIDSQELFLLNQRA